MEVQKELLEDIKNYLDITWTDPESDKKLSGITARGMAYINRIAGSEQDFTEEAKPREPVSYTHLASLLYCPA